MRLLVYREHSRTELRRKLQTRFPDAPEIDQVLDELEQRNYLSDERFVEEYLKSRIRKGYGPLRIKSELQERGISRDMIAQCLTEHDGQWYRLMQSAAASKLGNSSKSDYKVQQKTARFLEYRGFLADVLGNPH
jgi:regulatory protein